MKIVFVDNLLFEERRGIYHFDLQPHLGLISLASVVRLHGHDPVLIDPKLEVAMKRVAFDESLYRELANVIARQKPDVVGFTSLGCNFLCTVKVAAYLKSYQRDLPIILGGPHATILQDNILSQFPQFDIVVRNEAEEKIGPLLDAIAGGSLESVRGIGFRVGSRVISTQGDPVIADLDNLPEPSYEYYPIVELGLKSLRVEAGRGCPYKCTFCSTASFFGRSYRLKSSARLVREMDHLNEQYGVTDFSLTHDLFTVNRKKVLAFCAEVRDRGYTWACSARMDCVNSELLMAMYDSGCRSIYYGVETGSTRMQQVIEKEQDLSQFAPVLSESVAIGLRPTVSFITGYPEEELPDQAETLDAIGSCIYRHAEDKLNVQFHLLTPEPGTKLSHVYGGQLRYDGHVSDFNFPTLEPDDDLVLSSHADIFLNHHYFPSKIPRERHVFVTTSFAVLWPLGFKVLRHIITFYEGRLSYLIDALHSYARTSGSNFECTQSVVHGFFEETFGAGHYVTSLIRYMFAATALSRCPVRGMHTITRDGARSEPTAPTHDETAYILSPTAVVVQDLHNCPAIFEILEDGRTLANEIPDELRCDLGHYLIYLPDANEALVRTFALDVDALAVCDFFSSARTPQSFIDHFGGRDAALAGAVFDELCSMGLLTLTHVKPQYAQPITLSSPTGAVC